MLGAQPIYRANGEDHSLTRELYPRSMFQIHSRRTYKSIFKIRPPNFTGSQLLVKAMAAAFRWSTCAPSTTKSVCTMLTSHTHLWGINPEWVDFSGDSTLRNRSEHWNSFLATSALEANRERFTDHVTSLASIGTGRKQLRSPSGAVARSSESEPGSCR